MTTPPPIDLEPEEMTARNSAERTRGILAADAAESGDYRMPPGLK